MANEVDLGLDDVLGDVTSTPAPQPQAAAEPAAQPTASVDAIDSVLDETENEQAAAAEQQKQVARAQAEAAPAAPTTSSFNPATDDKNEAHLTDEQKAKMTEELGAIDPAAEHLGTLEVTNISLHGEGREDAKVDPNWVHITTEITEDLGFGPEKHEASVSINSRKREAIEGAKKDDPFDKKFRYVADDGMLARANAMTDLAFGRYGIHTFAQLQKLAKPGTLDAVNKQLTSKGAGKLSIELYRTQTIQAATEDRDESVRVSFLLTSRHRSGQIGGMPNEDLNFAAISSPIDGRAAHIAGQIVDVRNNIEYKRYEISFAVQSDQEEVNEREWLATYNYGGENDTTDMTKARRQAARISEALGQNGFSNWSNAKGGRFIFTLHQYNAQYSGASSDVVYRATVLRKAVDGE